MQIRQTGYGNNPVNFSGKKDKDLGLNITEKSKHKERSRNMRIAAAALAATAAIGSYQSGYLPNFHTHAKQDASRTIEAQGDYGNHNQYGDLDIILDSRTNKEKLEAAKKIIEQTRADYEKLHNEIWNNFPKMYDTTKGVEETESKSDSFDTSYKYFYNFYGTIAKIASGEEKPWENVETAQDASNLMQEILSESGSYVGNSHKEISDGEFVNKGELEVINKVLDELEKINPNVQMVAKIYRDEIQQAVENSEQLKAGLNFESRLTNEYSTHEGNDYEYIANIDKIEEQSKVIQQARENYESAKKTFLAQDNHSSEDVRALRNAYINYEHACNELINVTCGLDSNIEDSGIAIYTPELWEAESNIDSRLMKLDVMINPQRPQPPKHPEEPKADLAEDTLQKNGTGNVTEPGFDETLPFEENVD